MPGVTSIPHQNFIKSHEKISTCHAGKSHVSQQLDLFLFHTPNLLRDDLAIGMAPTVSPSHPVMSFHQQLFRCSHSGAVLWSCRSLSLWGVLKKKPLVTVRWAHPGGDGSDCWVTAVAALQHTDLVASGEGRVSANSYCAESAPASWFGQSGLSSWCGESVPTSWCGEYAPGLTIWPGRSGPTSW